MRPRRRSSRQSALPAPPTSQGAGRPGRPGGLGRLGRTLAATLALGGLVGAGESLAAGPPTKARAKAFATAVNLRAGDLPGFKVGRPTTPSASDNATGDQLARCAGGVVSAKSVYDVGSPEFTLTSGIVQQEVSSEVDVLPSAALVARDLHAVKSARGKKCLATAIGKLLAATKVNGAKFGHVSVESSALPAAGADGSFALRILDSATISGLKIPIYFDFFGVAIGPAEVSLTAFGFGRAVPSSDELGLVSVLLRRAQAARL